MCVCVIYFTNLKYGQKLNSRVSSWGDKIETAVHPGIGDSLLSSYVDLLLQELLILLIDVLGNGLPAVDTTE